MATITTPSLPLAFRCSKCFQTRCSSVDCVGQSIACELCGNENIVPEATEDRIAQGKTFISHSESVVANQFQLNEDAPPMTTSEIMKQVRQESIAKFGVNGLVSSRIQRFLGRLIDSAAMMLAIVAGAYLAYALAPPVPGEEPTVFYLAVLFAIPAGLQFCQFCMTAMDGRTVGKYCLNTKIVNDNGDPPGFLRGVVMRSWVNCLLAVIPLYGLIDSLWIFSSDDKRCLHDLLAGTKVIDAT